MSTIKTKEVTAADHRYEIRRMTPVTGGYIWQRLMAACFKAQQQSAASGVAQAEETEEAKAEAAKVSAEDKLRSLCGVAFMQLSLEDFSYVQAACMKAISRFETKDGKDGAIAIGFIPIMQDNGVWTSPDVADSPFLITKLMVEAVVFNLASFLSESSATPTA